MSTAARENYLATEVLTAAPQKLHLMLIDGAIRFAEKAQQCAREGKTVDALEAVIRAQEIVTQMTAAIDDQADPALARRVAAVYLFVFRSLVEAGYQLDGGKIADALRVLEVERETWRAVCGQSGQSSQGNESSQRQGQGQGQGRAVSDAPHAGVPGPAASARRSAYAPDAPGGGSSPRFSIDA